MKSLSGGYCVIPNSKPLSCFVQIWQTKMAEPPPFFVIKFSSMVDKSKHSKIPAYRGRFWAVAHGRGSASHSKVFLTFLTQHQILELIVRTVVVFPLSSQDFIVANDIFQRQNLSQKVPVPTLRCGRAHKCIKNTDIKWLTGTG